MVVVFFLFLLSIVVVFLINHKIQSKRRKNYTNNILQLNKFTSEVCAAKDENNSGFSVEKIFQDLNSKDISLDFSNLINGFTGRDFLK